MAAFMLKVVYLLAVAVIAEFVVRWELRQVEVFRPTVADFAHPIEFSGILQGDHVHRGGVTPTIGGYNLACGVYFLGIATKCRAVFPAIAVGKPLDAKVAMIPTCTGMVAVALSLRLQDGATYSTTPEKLAAEWADKSSAAIRWTPAVVVLLLIGPALMFWLIFRFI